MKVLFLGNSFADDTIQYVNEIASSLKIKKLEVYCLYIGGCSIDYHYENLLENRHNYEFRYYEDGIWKTQYAVSIQDILNKYRFDYISLQQASNFSGKAETYQNLNNLIKKLSKFSKAQFCFLQTWPYSYNSDHPNFGDYQKNVDFMYHMICQAEKEIVVTNDKIVKIIPSGTAIYLASKTIIKDKIYRDGFHLSFDIGRYISSLCFIDSFYSIDWRKVYQIDNLNKKDFKEIKKVVNVAIKCHFVV